ncbi:RidA family protein [Streptomyces sp. NPDC001034]|uniref:RidA family protein n=1 Tax=Streptomyces sp. NPDC001034 TaxID=3154375 RepID=UPI0033258432
MTEKTALTPKTHTTPPAYFEAEALTPSPAARTTVYVGLPPGLLIEIDALAVLDSPGAA